MRADYRGVFVSGWVSGICEDNAMTGTEPPERWYGPCPFCRYESTHELDSDVVCNKCGFRFRISDWQEA